MTNLNKPSTIQRTIAITEIHQVLHRYCILARENAPFHQMKDLFLPDGIFRLPNGTAVAPQDMGNVVQGKPPQMIRHHITSIDVQFVGPRNASTKSLFLAMTHRSRIDHWGYWQDDFQLDEQGDWLIAERMIVVEGQDPAGWYADTYCA